jgi:hypothetical protein
MGKVDGSMEAPSPFKTMVFTRLKGVTAQTPVRNLYNYYTPSKKCINPSVFPVAEMGPMGVGGWKWGKPGHLSILGFWKNSKMKNKNM